MSKNNSNSSNGIGLFSLMFLIFMTLKLTGYITWSWWWVTAPLWGGFALIGVIAIIAVAFFMFKKLK
jgi:hypothetical protein